MTVVEWTVKVVSYADDRRHEEPRPRARRSPAPTAPRPTPTAMTDGDGLRAARTTLRRRARPISTRTRSICVSVHDGAARLPARLRGDASAAPAATTRSTATEVAETDPRRRRQRHDRRRSAAAADVVKCGGGKDKVIARRRRRGRAIAATARRSTGLSREPTPPIAARRGGAACAVAAAGCGVGPGEAAEGDGDADRDPRLRRRGRWPRRRSRTRRRPTPSCASSTRAPRSRPRYGGSFVQSIDGLEGGTVDGGARGLVLLRQRDRLRSAPPRTRSSDGDRIWWDYRDWIGRRMRVPRSSAPGRSRSCTATAATTASRASSSAPAEPTRLRRRSPSGSRRRGRRRRAARTSRHRRGRGLRRAYASWSAPGTSCAPTAPPRLLAGGPGDSGVFASSPVRAGDGWELDAARHRRPSRAGR